MWDADDKKLIVGVEDSVRLQKRTTISLDVDSIWCAKVDELVQLMKPKNLLRIRRFDHASGTDL